tara:strand:+ start:1783 stop:3834 length:2052 start_codon:yes stop_codon:yes gene_type:complete
MALNPFFLQGSSSEQRLVQSLINEQLKMYGVEVTYIPRKLINVDNIFTEVESSKFDDNYSIEAYVNTYEGYAGGGDILTKFGMSLKDEVTLTISKERFEDFISPFLAAEPDSEVPLSTRPREGDLIYFPLGQRLFEVKFVEHEDPFYQLGKNYVYQLKCELFEYEDEVIDTSIDDIDRQIEDEGYITTLKLIGIGVTATASAVINTGYVRQVFLNNDGSGFTSPPVITFEDPLDNSGTTATAVGILTTVGGITSLKEIVLTNAGAGYTTVPNILIQGGGGTGAAATCSINPAIVGVGSTGVVSITVDTAGSGYPIAPTVTIPRPDAGATATATVGASGTITEFTITSGGEAYVAAPTVTISQPNRSGSISSFTLNSNGRKNGDVYTVVNDSTSGFAGSSGEDYEVGDILTLHPNNVGMGGTEALIRIDAVKAGTGQVQGFTMIYGGYDYEDVNATRPDGGNHNPSNDYYNGVNVSGSMNGDRFKLTVETVESVIGTTATGTAVVGAAGSISSITLTNAGGGYTKSPHANAPTVTISNDNQFKNPGVIQATAVATVNTSDQVSSIRITDPGSGYTSVPVITISDPTTIVGIGTYQFNEIIRGSTSGAEARVKSWDDMTNTLKVSYVSGTFREGENIVGTASSAVYSMSSYNADDTYDKYTENDEIESEADDILDFTESNPFGVF